ncbi:hypothetical protein E2C01_069017 [Portunus trituberculatus]|uniref:Uncharacterized protein n=1 Tax=Portunus trituberculatus TaxID=210409 RepID=A0A5B7I127_PORTR|nr:hypothetical protein [Portunus trituberculatus]
MSNLSHVATGPPFSVTEPQTPPLSYSGYPGQCKVLRSNHVTTPPPPLTSPADTRYRHRRHPPLLEIHFETLCSPHDSSSKATKTSVDTVVQCFSFH